jgi:hypothetical protein
MSKIVVDRRRPAVEAFPFDDDCFVSVSVSVSCDPCGTPCAILGRIPVRSSEGCDTEARRAERRAALEAEVRDSSGAHLPGESVLPGSYGEDGRQ